MKFTCLLLVLLAVAVQSQYTQQNPQQSLADVLAAPLPSPNALLDTKELAYAHEHITADGTAKARTPPTANEIHRNLKVSNSPLQTIPDPQSVLATKSPSLLTIKMKAPQIHDLRSDFKDLPGDTQLPGSFVKLKFAPGQGMEDEDVLPAALIPPKAGATAMELMDAKLWNELSGKIMVTSQSLNKYNRWIQGASLALTKVKEQLQATQENKLIIEKGLEAMKYQRMQTLKRLKSYKLKRDLDAATKRMKELKKYSEYLSKNKNSLDSHKKELTNRLNMVKSTLKNLQTAGKDPVQTITP